MIDLSPYQVNNFFSIWFNILKSHTLLKATFCVFHFNIGTANVNTYYTNNYGKNYYANVKLSESLEVNRLNLLKNNYCNIAIF